MATPSRRARRRRQGLPNWRVVRYADDFVVLVHGTCADVEALREDIAGVLQPLGLRLSAVEDPGGAHERWVRLLGVPHPVAPQVRDEQVARLHLHRRPADPVVEGQDSCPDEQDVAAEPQGRADQAQPDHARLVQLFQTRGLQAHPAHAGPLRLVAGGPMAADAAPLEMEGRPPPVHHPRWAVAADHGGRDRVVQPRNGAGHPIPMARQHDPQPLDPAQPAPRRQELWRARCGESRTPGSASGLGKRTGSNPDTAPQADSTDWLG